MLKKTEKKNNESIIENNSSLLKNGYRCNTCFDTGEIFNGHGFDKCSNCKGNYTDLPIQSIHDLNVEQIKLLPQPHVEDEYDNTWCQWAG